MKRGFIKSRTGTMLLCLLGLAVLGSHALAQTTQRVNVSSNGEQGNHQMNYAYDTSYDVSANGRYVVFGSQASNLVPGDSNGKGDVFIRDLVAHTTERVSLSSLGEQGNEDSFAPSISADGRYVAFVSRASNLVAEDTNGKEDIFVRDRMAGTTERVNVSSAGEQGNENSGAPYISATGRFVAYHSEAYNLVPNDTNGEAWIGDGLDVFVFDRETRITERVSVSTSGDQGDHRSYGPAITPDGRYVAFGSEASTLDLTFMYRGLPHVYLRDRLTGTTETISLPGVDIAPIDLCSLPSISDDGRYVAFASESWHRNDPWWGLKGNVIVRDRVAGTSELVSFAYTGANTPGRCYTDSRHSLSADGRYVVFSSEGNDLVPGDTNGTWDCFLHDRLSGITKRVSLGAEGVQSNGMSGAPVLSADGKQVVFYSDATNLVSDDTNGVRDIFVYGPVGPFEATISGKLVFPDRVPTAAPLRVDFVFRVLDGSAQYTRTLKVGQEGGFRITDVPSREYMLKITPHNHLAVNIYVDASDGSAGDVTATFLSGDANDDNSIDVLDLDLLLQAFDSTSSSPNSNRNADFNGDSSVDTLDLDILLRNFDTQGDP